jgi:hypothetical protein
MPGEVKLRLELVDVYGAPLKEEVDVLLRHQVLSDFIRRRVNAATRIEITGLRGAPQGSYRLEIDPPSYQYVSLFLNMKASGITPLKLVFPVDPDKITKVNFPAYTQLSGDLRRLLENSANVLSFTGRSGQELYESMDNIRRAGLLNIAVKSAATGLINGRTVLSYVQELKEVRGDRFFAVVPKELREETKHSEAERIFKSVSGSLHHPPSGFSSAGSFKTFDRAGNLQLTFFMNGDDCVADIDIDDAGGFEHIFQVLGNKLSGKPTHPYNIHEILLAAQQLDSGYTFEL